MAKSVRMSDIAKELGVSTVTVSKALSDQKGVSEEMREKIKELAQQMGYKTGTSAKDGGHPSYNIGVLVLETYIEMYSSFYWEFYQKINTSASKENCFVLLEIVETESEAKLSTPKLIQENKVDGLMILGQLSTEYLEMLQERANVPRVYMDFYDRRVQADSVISNSFYGAYHVTDYLFEMGHVEIGYVGTLLATESITDRYLGYYKAVMEHGKEPRKEWMIQDRESHVQIYEQLELPQTLPSAFVCNSDLAASKLIRALSEKGYKVPEDVSVVGYDDYLYPGLCDIGITTYSVDMEKMSQVGMEMLLERMEGNQNEYATQVIEGKLIKRESVREKRG